MYVKKTPVAAAVKSMAGIQVIALKNGIREPMTTIDATKTELELARKLFWLAAHDWIFFSTYNEDIDDYIDEGAFPAINTNDVLVPGADAMDLPAEDVDKYVEVCKQYSEHYPDQIWCIAKQGKKPWRDPNSLTAKEREGVAFACQLLGTENPYN